MPSVLKTINKKHGFVSVCMHKCVYVHDNNDIQVMMIGYKLVQEKYTVSVWQFADARIYYPPINLRVYILIML